MSDKDRYEVGYEEGENSMHVDYVLALDFLPFDFDDPMDLAKKLQAYLLKVKSAAESLNLDEWER